MMPDSNDESVLRDQLTEGRYRLARRTAAVAGIFSLLVLLLLGWDYGRRSAKDPLESPEFKALKTQLAADPRNAGLKDRIRQLDLRLRRAYFGQRSFTYTGAWLLLGGLALLLAASRAATTLRRKSPAPVPRGVPHDPAIEIARIGRWAVAALALVFVGLSVGLSQGFRSEVPRGEVTAASDSSPHPNPLPEGEGMKASGSPHTGPLTEAEGMKASGSPHTGPLTEAEGTKIAAASGDSPHPSPVPEREGTREEYQQNWPRFRGPDGSGITSEKGILTTWDGAGGKGILWKTPVPLPGHNSPVIWGQRLFLTGANEKTRKVFGFDLAGGKLLWQRDLPSTPESTAKPPKISEDTGYAASTTACDGRRVYAIFANGDVGGLDFQGNVVWARSLGIPQSSYGYATSLVTYKNLLLIQFDQGAPEDKLSKLLGLDSATGKTLWQTRRPVPNSWSSPIVAHVGNRDQLITAGEPWVIGYDLADGKEIWRANRLRQDVGPSPVFRNGVAYVVNQSPDLSAIRADGQGDVTKTHVLWSGEDNLPDICSPLATDEYVFLLNTGGTLTSYDAKSGKKLWEKDYEGQFKASPSLVGKYLYLITEEGKAYVVEPGPKDCREVSTAALGDPVTASPAFHAGRMYLRGAKNVYCIGAK